MKKRLILEYMTIKIVLNYTFRGGKNKNNNLFNNHEQEEDFANNITMLLTNCGN